MSEALTKDIIIRILTEFEKGGVEGAKNAIDELNNSENKTADSSADAAEKARALSSVMQGLASSASGSSEGIFKVANGLRTLLGSLPAAAGQAGLLVAAFLASFAAASKLIEAYRGPIESAEQYKDRVDRARTANEEFAKFKLDSINEEYEALFDKITADAEAQERLNAARRQMLDATTGAKLADVDLREKQALAALPADDDIGRSRARAGFANERAGIQDAAAQAKAAADAQEAKQKAESAQNKADKASAKVAKMEGEIEDLKNSITSKTKDAQAMENNAPKAPEKPPLLTAPLVAAVAWPAYYHLKEKYDKDMAPLQTLKDQIARDSNAVNEILENLNEAKTDASSAASEASAAGISQQAAEVRSQTASKLPQASAATAADTSKQIDYAAKKKADRDQKTAAEKAQKEQKIADLEKKVTMLEGQAKAMNGAEISVDEASDATAFAQEGYASAKKASRRASPQSFSYAPVAAAKQRLTTAQKQESEAVKLLQQMTDDFGGLEKIVPALQALKAEVKSLKAAFNFGVE